MDSNLAVARVSNCSVEACSEEGYFVEQGRLFCGRHAYQLTCLVIDVVQDFIFSTNPYHDCVTGVNLARYYNLSQEVI